jgi:myo-inositol-1(or 4)-monophosphatase
MSRMDRSGSALEADWLGACRRAAESVRAALAAHPTTSQRAVEVGRGEGGDRSLVIDRAAEQAVFDELDGLAAAGWRFVAVSEERGVVDYGDPRVRVVIDPIDGSLNAKRGLPPSALSIAVADGDTMADVEFAYVHDFGTGDEWNARRNAGAFLNAVALPHATNERRAKDGRLEMLAIESADPRWVELSIGILVATAYRLRAMGAIAIALCQLAAGRVDAMVSLRRCRSFDAAAGQLIAREAGALVSFPAFEAPLAAPLDLVAHSHVVAARSEASLERLTAITRL